MAKKTSKASTTSRSERARGEAAAPGDLPGLETPASSGPADPIEKLEMPILPPSPETPAPATVTASEPPAAPKATEDAPPVAVESPVAELAASALPDGSTSRRGRFARNELLALSGFAVLGLLSTVWFFRCLYAHPAEIGVPQMAKQFLLPLKGQFLTLAAADTGWRDRVQADRVRAEEVVLPTVHVKLDPSGSSRGFLRFEFLDTDGKIRGDISTVAVEAGRFKDSGRGEQVSADGTEVTVAGTVGFSSHSLFTIYLGGEETRWSVRLREGGDYSNGPWSLLGQARISDRKP